MKFTNFLEKFLDNAGYDKLFLTAVPGLCAIVFANSVFTFNFSLGIIILFSVILIQLAVKIFDDYMDWILGNPQKRLQYEQTGMRGRFDKCKYYLNEEQNPRIYFYIALFLTLISLIIFISVSVIRQNILLILPLILLFVAGYINYSPKGKKILSKTGSEVLLAFICGPLNMLTIYYASTKCITLEIIALSVIFFFFILNICFIGSILNLKSDIMTEKVTFQIILNNSNYVIYFTVFFNIFPYILTYFSIYYKFLTVYSYISFILLPLSLWLIYLIILYIKEPQKNIKWHFLMGADKYATQNEQNNLSWYSVRYNFARNIFVMYSIIIIFCKLL